MVLEYVLSWIGMHTYHNSALEFVVIALRDEETWADDTGEVESTGGMFLVNVVMHKNMVQSFVIQSEEYVFLGRFKPLGTQAYRSSEERHVRETRPGICRFDRTLEPIVLG